MLKIENTEVLGWEAAIRGLRNPMNSWDKSDSGLAVDGYLYEYFDIGDNDYTLMMNLRNAGTDHRKFMRMIMVSFDVTSNHTWWAEFDTYKVGTVRNSCSKMHKIQAKEFTLDNFSTEGIEECGGRVKRFFAKIVEELEILRWLYNKSGEKKYWRAIIEMLPMGYNLKATVMLNYEVLANIYKSRRNHKLAEWHTFCDWVESLPYSELITRKEKSDV